MEQLDLIDIFKTLHPKTVECTFFTSAHGIFSRVDNILGHRTSLNTFKRMEIISVICFDHNSMKLEINHRKRNKKKTITWRLNNMLIKNPVGQ